MHPTYPLISAKNPKLVSKEKNLSDLITKINKTKTATNVAKTTFEIK